MTRLPALPTAATPPLGPPYGCIIADPCWSFRSARLNGGVGHEYQTMSVEEICALPVADLCAPGTTLLLWTTGTHLVSGEALSVMNSWGFAPKTLMPWIKCTTITPGAEPTFGPNYGVGYWMRGCAEYVLVGQVPGGRSVRTPWLGLLSGNAKHSRKPNTIYEFAESIPGPYLELFGRRARNGWTVLGNEAPGDGRDIRESLASLGEAVR